METKRLKKGNKGFTLIEVLVAVGIASLALVSIGGFMAVGARSFASTSSDVNLQYESQLAFNQLQDLIVDTQLGITQVTVDESSGTETEVPADQTAPDDVDQKALYIYNRDQYYKIIWDRSESQLYYEERGYLVNGSGKVTPGGAVIEAESLMAEYLTDFDIDLSRLEEKRIVGVHMTFQKSGKEYDANYNITIRNKIAVNQPLADIYTDPVPSVPATSIIIDPVITVEPGSVYTFPAPTVTSSDALQIPSQEVRWDMDESLPADAGTYIDVNTGKLKVAESESHETFNVKVTTRDGTASSIVTVQVRKVSNVAIDYQGLTNDESGNPVAAAALTGDSEFMLTAQVTMNFETELTLGASGKTLAEAKAVSWEIQKGEEYLSGTANGNVWTGKLSSNLATGKELAVRATATASVAYEPPLGKYGDWTGTTLTKKKDFDIVTYDGNIIRGQRYAFNIAGSQSGNIYLFDITVRRRIYDESGAIVGYEELDSEDFIDRTEQGNNVKIKIPDKLPPYDVYEIDIRCYAFKLTGNQQWSILYGYLKDYSSYKIEDAVGQSWMDTIVLEAAELYFENANVLTKCYIPRDYGQFLNDTAEKTFYVTGITNLAGHKFNLDRDHIKWKYYVNPTGGKTKDSFIPYTNTDMFGYSQDGTNLKVFFTRRKWDNNLPQVLYMVPTITVDGEEFLMYHTYIRIMAHNIEVTYKDQTQNLFFPYPLCEKDSDISFPGKDLTGNNKMNGEWYRAFDFNDTLYYTLQRWEDSDGGVNYGLTLYSESKRTDDCELGYYIIKEGQTGWTRKS